MSDITISRPEVVTGHTDVICSTSIRHILAVRKSTLLQIDTPVSYTHLDVYKRQPKDLLSAAIIFSSSSNLQ